jgi:hypothetical protein
MTISLSSLQVSPLSSVFSPSSQKAGDRPISFVLIDSATGGGAVSSMALNIRPEELTRTEMSRVSVQQALGGAWADDFGPGLAQINISGHTGWRGSVSADGMELFAQLKKLAYTNWHAARNAARAAAVDPNGVSLTFADALDSTTDVVIPTSFVLRRSKSRPLLMQYQIAMIATGLPIPATTSSSAFASALDALGLTSLANSITSLTNTVSSIATWVNTTIVAPVKAFVTLAVNAFNAVVGVINSATGIVSNVLSTVQAVARAGMQVMQTLATIASLPTAIAAQITATAGLFSNVFCVLKNAVATKNTYPDYTTLLGASNCSSTAGGSTASTYTTSGTNPFNDVIGTPTAPVITATAVATTALQTINNTDPVLSPMSTTTIAANLKVINSGLTVSA